MNDLVAQELPKGLQEPGVVAGATVKSLIPTTLEGVWRVANILIRSPFVPKDLNTAEACASAIMLGLDVGLNPIQAVQSIAVINGRPSIWGDAALALCLAHPLCEDVVEEFSGDLADESTWLYTCTAKRKGRTKHVIATFSYADAQKAGLLGKSGPWQQYRRRMIQLRARAFCLRDAFPDILKGLAIREEMEDVEQITTGRGRGELPKPPSADNAGGAIIDAEVREVKTEAPAQPEKPAAAEEKDAAKEDPAPTAAEEKKPEPKPAKRKPNGWPALLEAAEFAVDDGLCVKDASGTYQPGQAIDPKDLEDADLVLENNVIVRKPGDAKQEKPVDHIAEIKRRLQAASTIEELSNVIPKGATTDLAKAFDAASPEDQTAVKNVYAARKAELTASPAGDQQDDGENPGELVEQFTKLCASATSLDTLDACMAQFEERIADLPKADREKVEAIFDAATTRIRNAPAEGDQQDEGEAEQKGADKDPKDMTAAEYVEYCEAYINAATSAAALKTKFFGESGIRQDLKVSGDDTNRLRAMRTAKGDELIAAGKA